MNLEYFCFVFWLLWYSCRPLQLISLHLGQKFGQSLNFSKNVRIFEEKSIFEEVFGHFFLFLGHVE